MKWIVCSVLIFLGTSFFAADENKDHNYSPGLSKRSSGDTESGKDYVGYSDESNFNNFDREKSNTYKMSVSPPSGGTFIPESTCSGEVTKDEANLVTMFSQSRLGPLFWPEVIISTILPVFTLESRETIRPSILAPVIRLPTAVWMA